MLNSSRAIGSFGLSTNLAGEPAPRLRRTPPSAVASVRTLPPATRLLTEDDPVGAIYEILDGAVVLSRTCADGQRQILDVVGPGRLIGMAVGGTQHCDADTLTRVRLRTVDGGLAVDQVARELQTSLHRLYDQAVLLGRRSARERVASALLQLGDMFGTRAKGARAGEITFVLPLTRGDLADWLGLVLETVSRALSGLQRDGVIVIERTDIVHVVDPAALRAAAACRAARRAATAA